MTQTYRRKHNRKHVAFLLELPPLAERQLRIPQRKTENVVTAMSNNASFPNPSPPLTEVNAAADEVTQAYSLVQAGGGALKS